MPSKTEKRWVISNCKFLQYKAFVWAIFCAVAFFTGHDDWAIGFMVCYVVSQVGAVIVSDAAIRATVTTEWEER